MPDDLSFIFRGAVSLWSLAIAAYDLRERRLPNGLTIGGWLAGGLVLLVWGQGVSGASVASCLAAAGLALLISLPAYARNALGAGDVKLMVAIALTGGVRVLGFTFVMAGLFCAVWLVYYFTLARRGVATHVGGPAAPLAPTAAARPVPFGAALALGLFCVINLPMEWLSVSTPG